ncbi:MFS transporter [Bordetella sp. LUAb4]|uniref:MFS transporter n=1 Tax=Bordetella sp. LUAb4 TaxID=2843195 RepID=UPI001E59764F
MNTLTSAGLSMPAPAVTPAYGGRRIAAGLAGVLLAVVSAQINDHVTEIALPDLRGIFGVSHDDGTWLTTLYHATQVIAAMYAPWCSATFTLRRLTLAALTAFALLGLCMPFAPSLGSLYLLRGLQGLAGGCLPPMLMTVALRFLPASIKLYGLGAYALTATFAPNLGTPLAAFWGDYVGWRWLFWQIVPMALLAAALVAWGLPQDPPRYERLKQFNWRGVLLGAPGMAMLVVALEHGTRLGWLDSPFIVLMFAASALLLVLFVINEWFHPLPFFKIQFLARRNLTFGLVTVGGVLLVLVAWGAVPAAYLAEIQGYRPLQMAPLALIVAVPQLIALPAVAALCNMRRVDCRWVLASGLGLIALSCLGASFMTRDWIRDNFYLLQMLQVLGQPMAVIPLLMLSTHGMAPTEGPFASAWFNTVKGFAGVLGAGVTEGLYTWREHLHSHVLVDQMGNRPQAWTWALREVSSRLNIDAHAALAIMDERIRAQASILASADVLRTMAVIAVLFILAIPFVPTRIEPPKG